MDAVITAPAVALRPPPFAPEIWATDPRLDLVDDSARWDDLLSRAYLIDGDDPCGLFGRLLGLRCEGARLIVVSGRVRLEAGELGSGYPALRESFLVPYRDRLTALLAEVNP